MSNNKFKLALALDNVSTIKEIESLVDQTSDSIGVYKVGLELFTRFGAAVLSVVKKTDRVSKTCCGIAEKENLLVGCSISGECCFNQICFHRRR